MRGSRPRNLVSRGKRRAATVFARGCLSRLNCLTVRPTTIPTAARFHHPPLSTPDMSPQTGAAKDIRRPPHGGTCVCRPKAVCMLIARRKRSGHSRCEFRTLPRRPSIWPAGSTHQETRSCEHFCRRFDCSTTHPPPFGRDSSAARRPPPIRRADPRYCSNCSPASARGPRVPHPAGCYAGPESVAAFRRRY